VQCIRAGFHQGLGATLEELAGPDAELWELGVVVTEPGAAAWTRIFSFCLHPKYQWNT